MRRFLKSHFESPDSGKRLIPMEGMRGFAALLVFFVHFDALFRPYFHPGSFAAILAEVAGRFG
jgi:peptidoglycan/LPS O-acetylase OafA/YrhL